MNDISRFTEVEYFEKTVLATAFKYQQIRSQFKLEPEHFEDDRHGAIASRLLSDSSFDYKQLISESVKSPATYGDYEFVKQIGFMNPPSEKSFTFDQTQVLEQYKQRELAKTIDDYTRVQSAENRIRLRNRIDQLEKIELSQGIGKLDTLSHIFKSLYEEKDTAVIKTGLNPLDHLITGMEQGQFNLIAARPSMGKTALALQVARNMEEENKNIEILFFSLETTEMNVTQRILSNMTNVNLMKFKQPKEMMTMEDIDKVLSAIELYNESSIKIYDDARLTPNAVRAAASNVPVDKTGVIFIDYIQLMDADTRHREKRHILEEVSRELKVIAKEMNVTIIALSQLSRASDGRQDKRPVLSDLRETGQLEQDANIVAFCYRDDYYFGNGGGQRENGAVDLEIIIAKNKDGPTGTAVATFYKETQRIIGR
ncbi:DnaB-like helicase C-terminal domain-containing protein [Salinicoccus sesuvii]|uniref:DnaB-like helicase C-terminal domain-containing protein n=1 Tax=Salinicoccus sesuvii TaxID=868281 RepID=A0ABV7N574_9STAP